MDKNAIKKFAVWAREELIRRVSSKAEEYGITAKESLPAGTDSIRGKLLSSTEQEQRGRLLEQIRGKGYEQVMEEVAYTWFNRLIALRFMEVNGYLPSRVRVFTDEENRFKPQILTEAIHMELAGLDMDKVISMKQSNDDGNLYKYLLITQCNALSAVLPQMFQRIENYTELLFPDNILREGSVIGRMISDIREDDWRDQVQIIGWLYQYYNSVPKDEVFAALKKNVKITKEKIPAATQLFTPDWIVRYMVENSLGRLWVEGHPNGELKSEWKYYLDEAEQTPEVQARLTQLRKGYATLNPEDIKLIDPCMGSGHILVYAFDVFMQIYRSCGYTDRDAVGRILARNLYGLDIDKRAAQLAYFSVMMKAVEYDSRFLRRNNIPQPNLYHPGSYADGLEYGSLLIVDELEPEPEMPESPMYWHEYEENLNTWSFRYLLAQKYDVVVTNPPYMAVSNASGKLQEYVKKNFSDSKADLFACFIERCGQLTSKSGYQAMITQHAWMFLSSFEKLREKLQAVDTVNMAHLGPRAFEEIGGEVVQTTSFVLRKSHIKGYQGAYCRLIEPNTQQGKEDMFLAGENRYISSQTIFRNMPKQPFVYWANKNVVQLFNCAPLLRCYYTVRNGLTTGDNARFLRLWYEVADKKKQKWFPCNKGGYFRRWYGNKEYYINWENDGYDLKHFYGENGRQRSTLRSIDYNFKPSLVVAHVASGDLAYRFVESGFISESAVNSIYEVRKGLDIYYLLALLNSKPSNYIVSLFNPTLGVSPEDVQNIPILFSEENNVIGIAKKCVEISNSDWDCFETSWDFKRHPLVPRTKTQDISGDALEFSVFCVESVAESLGVSGEAVYHAFTKKSDLLDEYIIPLYEPLHTQGKDYIVDVLLEAMEERGVEI